MLRVGVVPSGTLKQVGIIAIMVYTTLVIHIDNFGAWSTSGCREATDGGNHTVCECNQLGHFGILFVSRKLYRVGCVLILLRF